MNEEKIPEGAPTLKVIAMPKDSNVDGDIFGGWIAANVDLAGSIPAIVRAGGRVVTAAIQDLSIKKPAFVGDLLSFYAEISSTGRTSMTVTVTVIAERRNASVSHVAVGKVVYVAVDENRRPCPLPPFDRPG